MKTDIWARARNSIVAGLALAATTALPAAAADWVLGVKVTDFGSSRASTTAGLNLEVHGRPYWHLGPLALGFAAAGTIDTKGNAWVGVGLSALGEGASPWFFEASLMPGYYRASNERFDLGKALEFRSLIGVGYRLTPDTRVSLALSHVSNASRGRINPGADSLSLRIRRAF
ncbi:acyloxyacyl hydrolase [Alkalilacustris brevis]|uniref:acyloxyacyl hydrolase n=1 Tax=Alkalilacustris brevis TaxID=2026338 RepID=UPI000E0D2C70|nr:acyloxyacyl hydrolase [Alkalilacustris brevis]